MYISPEMGLGKGQFGLGKRECTPACEEDGKGDSGVRVGGCGWPTFSNAAAFSLLLLDWRQKVVLSCQTFQTYAAYTSILFSYCIRIFSFFLSLHWFKLCICDS